MRIALGGHVLLGRPQLEILHSRKGFRIAANLPNRDEGPVWRAYGPKKLHQLLELRLALYIFPAENHARDKPGLKQRANRPWTRVGGRAPPEFEEQDLARQAIDLGIRRAGSERLRGSGRIFRLGDGLARPFAHGHRRCESRGRGIPGIRPAEAVKLLPELGAAILPGIILLLRQQESALPPGGTFGRPTQY